MARLEPGIECKYWTAECVEILELGWTVGRIKMRGELGNVAINLIFNVEEIPAKTLLSS